MNMTAKQYQSRYAKNPNPDSEESLTKKVACYLETLKEKGVIKVFSHIPSSTFTKFWSVKVKNKAMGVRPGIPDMLIVFKKSVLFLELKRKKGGVVSKYQKQWIQALGETNQVVAKIARGWDEAKLVIDSQI